MIVISVRLISQFCSNYIEAAELSGRAAQQSRHCRHFQKKKLRMAEDNSRKVSEISNKSDDIHSDCNVV